MSWVSEMTKAWAERAGIEVRYSSETSSTNDAAKADVDTPRRSTLAPLLYVTANQTGGRGRGQNTWSNTEGALLSSWSFHAVKPPQPIFAPLAGLAAYRALSATWPNLNWSMKAPNDIYLGEKKVAGLLIETIDGGNDRRTIVGIGLNVLSAPSTITTATSLSDVLGEKNISPDLWGKFLQKLLLGLISALNAGQNVSLLPNDSKDLLEALNRRPNLPEKIQKVGPQSELHTASGIIRWQDL